MGKKMEKRKRPIKKTTGLRCGQTSKYIKILVTHNLDPFGMLKTILKIYCDFTDGFAQYQTRNLMAMGSGSLLHYVCYILLDSECCCDLWWQVCRNI